MRINVVASICLELYLDPYRWQELYLKSSMLWSMFEGVNRQYAEMVLDATKADVSLWMRVAL